MNRRGFMGALAASGLIPWMAKGETEDILPDADKIQPIGMAVDPVTINFKPDIMNGGFMVREDFRVKLERAVRDARRKTPYGHRVRLEGARALYHG